MTISNENGALWTCDFSPFNGSDTAAVGRASCTSRWSTTTRCRAARPRPCWPLLAVGGGQQVDHLHHPQGRQVQRRHADDGRRRGVHLQPAQEVPGAGPDRGVVGAVQRQPGRLRPGHHGLQGAGGARLLLHRRPDPDRARAHLVEDRQPGDLRRHPPGRHRPVRGEPVHQGRTSPTRPTRTTGSPGEPHIDKVEYPAYTSNNTANDQLASGQAQWGSQYIPGIKAFYTAKSPNFHYWFPPTVNVSLVPNLKNPLLANVKVRQAMSYAIDRARSPRSASRATSRPPTRPASSPRRSPAGWTAPRWPSTATTPTTRPRRSSCWPQPGFKMGSDGIMANAQGQKLAFSVINIGDYSDWVASMQVIPQNLKAVGIQLTPDNLTNTDFDADLYYGKYQLAYYDQQTLRPEPVLRAAELAGLGRLGPDRPGGGDQLRALQQPGHRRAVQRLRRHDQHGPAARDHRPAGAGHAEPAADHPGRAGGGLVPVRHQRH